MEPEVRQAPVRFYEIDLLRFLAALAVVFFHYTYRGYMADQYSPIAYPELGRFTKYGYLGVELFFIISGYVVLLSAQGKTVRQFFLSRITRLYPAFWVACTLTFVAERLWGPRAGDVHMSPLLHAGFGQYAYNMTMLHGFAGTPSIDGVYWSLTIEIAFYFLITVLIGFKLLKHLDGFMLAWLIFIALPGIAHSGTAFSFLLFPAFAAYFIAGMLFYLLQQPQGRKWWRYAMLAAAYGLAVRETTGLAADFSVAYHDEISRKAIALIITAFFLVFGLVSARKLNFSRLTWLAWPGALTYPLYLIHSNIGFLAFQRIGYLFNKYVLLGGTVLFMLLAAYLIHVLVEKRFSRPLGTEVAKWLGRLD